MIEKLKYIFGGFTVIILWIAFVCFGMRYCVTWTMFGAHETAIGSFFFACILAPLWEEAAYRHAPLQLAKKFGKAHGKNYIIPVVILSSALFGWGHDEGPLSILKQGAGGMVLSYVYIKTGYNYWCSVATHFLWNFSLMYVFPILNA